MNEMYSNKNDYEVVFLKYEWMVKFIINLISWIWIG